MSCQDTQKLLHGYVDDELDLRTCLEIEEHLQQCAACAEVHQSLRTLRAVLGSEGRYFEPPTALRTRIYSAVRTAETGHPTHERWFTWLAVAASLLLVAVAAWGLVLIIPARQATPALAEALIASHVRSQMLPGHLVDVPSSDQHTVKPWLEGKLDFSPEVPDLSREGFTLVGGRLDYLEHRPVAAVVYQRRKHLITLFIWPVSTDSPPSMNAVSRQGFHLISWQRSGMVYWVVSDLNENELNDFVRQVQAGPRRQ